VSQAYILVEGHGEVKAVNNLVSRLSSFLGFNCHWAPALRWKNLHLQSGIERGANFIRGKDDALGLLILRDEEDGCPAERAPVIASWLQGLHLPFPAAVVLLKPEYEVMFLPCLHLMAGRPLGSGAASRPGLRPAARWEGAWERRRGIKEWLSENFPPNRRYKPTLDQLPMTRMIDLAVLRQADVPCFGTLERALQVLNARASGAVYPEPSRSITRPT
jgi:hypothetical protein